MSEKHKKVLRLQQSSQTAHNFRLQANQVYIVLFPLEVLGTDSILFEQLCYYLSLLSERQMVMFTISKAH